MQNKLEKKSLFSNETLNSIVMAEVYGGEDKKDHCSLCVTDDHCGGAKCSCPTYSGDKCECQGTTFIEKNIPESIFSIGMTANNLNLL